MFISKAMPTAATPKAVTAEYLKFYGEEHPDQGLATR
jgi:hypothetical protein